MTYDGNHFSVLEAMNESSHFTETEWATIQYIKEHLQDVSSMSIRSLAEETFVSNGTIIRICRKIGCEGFKEFKQALIKELEAQKYIKQTVDFDEPFKVSKNDLSIFRDMASLYRETIDLVQKNLDQARAIEAGDLISRSDLVYLYAVGDSAITTEAFANRLAMLGKMCQFATHRSQQRAFTEIAQRKDCALFVSYSGSWPMVNESLQPLKDKKVPIIALTGNRDSELYRKADIRILIPAKETSRSVSTFYSQIAFMFILNSIYSLVYCRIKSEQK